MGFPYEKILLKILTTVLFNYLITLKMLIIPC